MGDSFRESCLCGNSNLARLESPTPFQEVNNEEPKLDDPIISRDLIREKACRAFARGAGRDDHGFNWHCKDAIETWQHEWDRQNAERTLARVRGNQQLEAA
jgi:hypothetical protein